MKIAAYRGNHSDKSLIVRALTWAQKRIQTGLFRDFVHVEAIHAENADGTYTIASATFTEGVRTKKNAVLDPNDWAIFESPLWDMQRSIAWFSWHDGLPYDSRGALATVLPGAQSANRYFCSEAVGASIGLESPGNFGPPELIAIAVSFRMNWAINIGK